MFFIRSVQIPRIRDLLRICSHWRIASRMVRAVFLSFYLCVFCAGLLSACGFALKGHHEYAFKRLYIVQTGSVSPAIAARLQRLIEATGKTVIVDNPKQADAFLNLSVERNQAVLSINLEGLVEEYELDLTVQYALSDPQSTMFIPLSIINVNRSMTYSDQYALAKATESEFLYTDMENDAVDQLVRRLAAVKSLDPDAPPLPSIRPRIPLPPSPL
jgi:LPS-assembly lipoprotein